MNLLKAFRMSYPTPMDATVSYSYQHFFITSI